MTTLHLDTGRQMGGGQWQVLRLVRGLAARGDRPILLARGELLQRASQEGLSAEPFRWLRWPKVDLIHAHDAHAHAAAALWLPCPSIVARRVAYPIKAGWLSRWKYARATRYIAVSQFVRRKLLNVGIPVDKIDVVYDGVPLLPLPERRERAITLVHKAAAGYFASSNLEQDLKTASLLIYISQSEGLGSGILMAMSAGVPVIASDTGGIPEIVANRQNGLLVSNNPASIPTAVDNILANIDYYSANARQTVVDRFTEQHMVENTLAVYRKTLNDG